MNYGRDLRARLLEKGVKYRHLQKECDTSNKNHTEGIDQSFRNNRPQRL